MTITEDEVDAPPRLEPYMGDISAIAFGIEHEYNDEFYSEAGACDCGECGETPSERAAWLPDGWSQGEEHCGWEVRTGIEHNIREVVDTFTRLERTFATSHENCGLHIHVNCLPEHGLAVNPVRFIENWKRFHTVIEAADPGDPDSQERDVGEWCYDVHGSSTARLLAGLHGALGTDQLSAFGTIEVRRGTATDNMEAFEHYLRLVLGLAHMSAFRPGETPVSVVAPYATHASDSSTLVGNIDYYLRKTGISHTEVLETVRVHNQQLLAEAEATATW